MYHPQNFDQSSSSSKATSWSRFIFFNIMTSPLIIWFIRRYCAASLFAVCDKSSVSRHSWEKADNWQLKICSNVTILTSLLFVSHVAQFFFSFKLQPSRWVNLILLFIRQIILQVLFCISKALWSQMWFVLEFSGFQIFPTLSSLEDGKTVWQEVRGEGCHKFERLFSTDTYSQVRGLYLLLWFTCVLF